jgi:peroxiredoxin
MKLKSPFCLILVLLFIVAGCKKKENGQQQQTEVGANEKPTSPSVVKAPPDPDSKPAPMFTLKDLNGNTVSLSDFKGKVIILDFWATWCPPCVKEIPHFVELYDQYNDREFVVVGISVDREGVGVVKSFVQKYKVDYPILMTDGQVEKAYGNIVSIPTTFVIDSEGKIRSKYIGYRDKSVFEKDIKALLAEAQAKNN